MRERAQEWNYITKPTIKTLEQAKWLVISEFGIATYSGIKRVDIAAVKWDEELDILGFECKYEGTSRQSLFSALGQAIEYQQYFPDVFIVTQNGEFFNDTEKILKTLGLGLITIDTENNLGEVLIEPSFSNNQFFNEEFYDNQVRNRGILLITFNALFPESYKKGHYGGSWQGDYWIHDRAIGKVQFRGYTGVNPDTFFGINIEAVAPIRNIYKNIDVNTLQHAFSKLPDDYTIELLERTTYIDKNGQKILNRSKGSIPIKKSIFEQGDFSVCNITNEQIQREILDNIKKYDYYIQLLIDKKIWKNKDDYSKNQYIEKINEAKNILTEIYDLFSKWSRAT